MMIMRLSSAVVAPAAFALITTTVVDAVKNPNNQPTELVSENGVLEVTLVVDDLVSVQETKIAPAYNGEPCGPTLKVKAGDTLKVTLTNNLQAMSPTEQEFVAIREFSYRKGGVIAYRCKTQSVTATSSTEAEFIAAVSAAKTVLYLRSILHQLGLPQDDPTVIYEDNASAINMINHSVPTERSRHIDIQMFAIQSWAQDLKAIVLTHLPGVINPADALTKPLGWVLHYRHIHRLLGHHPPAYVSSSTCQNQMGRVLQSGNSRTEKLTELYDYVQNPQNEIDNLANVTAIDNRLDITNGNVYNPTYGFWGLNLVNLHFHGADFPSTLENIQDAIDGGGQSKTYTFEIPDNHDGGLFWYHNHVHGTTAHAYMANLYGFLVIEGKNDILTESPGIKGSTEVFMMLSEGLVDPVTKRVPPFFPIVGAVDLWYSVSNGYAAFESEYTFEQGETVLFRVAAAGVEPTIRLFIPGMTFVVVARDGIPLPKPQQVDVVEVSDGGRVEFLATFDTAGTYSMSRQPWGSMFAPNLEACQAGFGPDATYPCISYDIEQLVATITVVENNDTAAVDSRSSSDLIDTIVLPPMSERRQALAVQEPVGEKTLTLDTDRQFPLFQIPLTGEPGPPGVGFGMNNRLATPHHSDGEVMAGTCETWTVISNPPGAEHAFHLHGAKYLVLDVDGVAVEEPYWRDTMIVNANFTAKVCFDRVSAGDQLLAHCHAPSHMDIGMLTKYAVIENDNPPSSASTSTGLLGHIFFATALFLGVFL